MKYNRSDLLTNDDKWNAVIAAGSEVDFPAENESENELFLLSQYYSELESGGHESLFRCFSDYIEQAGIITYLNKLIKALKKIKADGYAEIEKEYGAEIWNLLRALDQGQIEEDKFYRVVETADKQYYKRNDELEKLLEVYFVNNYTEWIEVTED